MQMTSRNLKEGIHMLLHRLNNYGEVIKSNTWQATKCDNEFLELLMVSLITKMESDNDLAAKLTDCTVEWCNQHFEERVGGIPLNPPPSHQLWSISAIDYSNQGVFSHSYPERLWSKTLLKEGIRFNIGDLQTAVDVLKQDPTTRQCYVPIWFPEDLEAAKNNERVPCTLGWHFILRNKMLHCFYPIRSCDAIRHFKNDIYLANKLTNWMIKESGIEAEPGLLHFSATSFHCFTNDKYTLNQWVNRI